MAGPGLPLAVFPLLTLDNPASFEPLLPQRLWRKLELNGLEAAPQTNRRRAVSDTCKYKLIGKASVEEKTFQKCIDTPTPQACVIVFGAWDPNFFAWKYA